MKPDIRIRLTHKEAKVLLAAFSKGVFDKLTPAQASAIQDFHEQLLIEVQSTLYPQRGNSSKPRFST